MSVITISRGSYSKGMEIAEKIAKKMSYKCISRDILLEASEQFNVPEIKLIRAIHDAPSILDRLTYEREKYVAYIQVALLRQLQKDNVVYHGLAGHFFLKDIPHVLKVRIIADMEDRVRLEMKRENIPRSKALQILKNDDEQRRKWGRHLYGIDTKDSSLYDLVINIKKISADDAVEIIHHTVELPPFRTTGESQKAMDDLLLSAEVRVALVGFKLEMEISADNGVVYCRPKTQPSKETGPWEEIEKAIRKVPGVTDVKMQLSSKIAYANPWHKI